MDNPIFELYTDYLLSSYGPTTATGLSAVLEGAISHDRVTRFLSRRDFGPKDLWRLVKKTVRAVEADEGVLIFDDTIQEKRWTDENDLICWHYDHTRGRMVKGLNLLSALYHAGGVSIPVDFRLIRKPIVFCDVETRQVRRKAEVTKNERLREMFEQALRNRLRFGMC